MNQASRIPIASLIERFERNASRAAFMFFAVCGVCLGVLLMGLRLPAAIDGEAMAVRQVVQGVVISLISLLAIPFIRRGRHRSIAAVVLVLVFLIIAFSLFGLELGVRSASTPFTAFALLLSVMVFGLRTGLWIMGLSFVMLSAAALAELGGFITGPMGERFVNTEINLLCLGIMYLFAIGFCMHMDRQSRRLSGALEERREALRLALAEIEHAQGSKERFLKLLSSEVEVPLHGMVQAIETIQADERRMPAEAGGIGRMSARVMQFLESALGSARKLSTGGLDLELCSPVQMLQIRCDHWARVANAKALSFVQDIDATFSPTCVGPAQLYLDAINAVLDNAIRYTVQGNVLVRLQVLEKNADAVIWRLVVSDTGSGVAESVMHRLRNFLRDDAQAGALNAKSDARLTGGFAGEFAGVGGLLALKRWADATGGEADILSRVGQGCIVSVSFELRRAGGT